jgi:hypothetical protein
MRLLGRFKERPKEDVQDSRMGTCLLLFLAGAAGGQDKARAGHE